MLSITATRVEQRKWIRVGRRVKREERNGTIRNMKIKISESVINNV